MAKQFSVTRAISAPPEAIWDLLTDAASQMGQLHCTGGGDLSFAGLRLPRSMGLQPNARPNLLILRELSLSCAETVRL